MLLSCRVWTQATTLNTIQKSRSRSSTTVRPFPSFHLLRRSSITARALSSPPRASSRQILPSNTMLRNTFPNDCYQVSFLDTLLELSASPTFETKQARFIVTLNRGLLWWKTTKQTPPSMLWTIYWLRLPILTKTISINVWCVYSSLPSYIYLTLLVLLDCAILFLKTPKAPACRYT